MRYSSEVQQPQQLVPRTGLQDTLGSLYDLQMTGLYRATDRKVSVPGERPLLRRRLLAVAVQ
ncbi:hypothetical protein RKD41_004861 [Streptomyces tendae]